MRFDKLDLNLLVALDTLLTERNITRAADKLHLSQSAMSNALGRLRGYFGDPLLVPLQRRIKPSCRRLWPWQQRRTALHSSGFFLCLAYRLVHWKAGPQMSW